METTGSELTLVEPGPLHKVATDVAGVCKTIVEATAVDIEGRKYVCVEGWQAIANAFGCTASARDVTKVFDDADDRFIGFRATGEVKRNSDGMVLANGEGFVGTDEHRWFGGEKEVWNKNTRKRETKMFLPAPEFQARAMAQTRAISRACRAAFAFVVVLINKDLSTTPAEEVDDHSDYPTKEKVVTPAAEQKQPSNGNGGNGRWQAVKCTFGTKNGPLRGKLLGELTDSNLKFLHGKFSAMKPEEIGDIDKPMVEALKQWAKGQEQ